MKNHHWLTGATLRKRATLLFAGAALSAVVASQAAAFQNATRYSLAQGQQFTNAGRQLLSISPDGSQFVYVASNNLFVRGLTEKEARVVQGVSGTGGISNPVFSPDGKSIAYWSAQDQSLKRISAGGGTPQTICPASNPYGMSWSADDTILFGQGAAGIRRVPAAGGTAETIITVKAGELAHGPQLLDGGNVLYTLASNSSNAQAGGISPDLLNLLNDSQLRGIDIQQLATLINGSPGPIWDKARIVVQSLKANESKTLIEGGSDARYAPTGHIVYGNAGKVMAVRFDAARLEVSGSPVKLLDGVRNAGGSTGTLQFSFSNTGSLVYISETTGQVVAQRQMAFVDLSGKVTPLRHVPASIFGPRISPTGKQVAYRDNGAVWIADLSSEAAPRRLTTEPGEGPIWSPDGERIAFISILNGMEALFWRRADGTGSAELLADRARAPESWSADNKAFTFITLVGPSGDAGDYDIWTYSLQDKKAAPLIVIPASAQSGSRFSPDSHWMAYESNETGRAEIYVEPLPRTGQRFQISKTGGSRPLWAPDMSKLYFDNNTANAMRIISVAVRTQPTFSWGDPETLPIKDFIQPAGTIRRQYDITPDGKQFLMTFPSEPQLPQIALVTNWFDQLKAR